MQLSSQSDLEIVTSRAVNASQEKVYKAWTDPKHLKVWWGPNGFTNTFNEFDFRVGGRWSFIMHGPEKGNYPNECEFTKIDPPRLISWKRHSKPLSKWLPRSKKFLKTKHKFRSDKFLIPSKNAIR